MAQCRADVVAWVGSNVVPHEAMLRAWLRRLSVSEDEIGDIVQDAYVSIARLDSVAHIRNPRTYLFQTARNGLLARIRRERIVQIDRLAEIDSLHFADSDPGPERRVSARLELQRIRRLIDGLPDRCREIFEMRRVNGVSQKEIAARLGLAEHIVEAQAARGLRLILKAIAGQEATFDAVYNGQESGRGTSQIR